MTEIEMPTDDSVLKTVHFQFCDALRTIAIVLVVLSHIVMVIPALNPLEPFRLAMGSWGVCAFFVLSGFLLGRPYMDVLLSRRRFPSWKSYARRRFLRIWPAYATVVFIAASKSVLHHGVDFRVAADMIVHLLMIHNFFPAFVAGSENIALWTMAVDAQFYVALPVAAWILYRRSSETRHRDVIVFLGAVILLSVVWRIVIPFVAPNSENYVLTVQRSLVGMGMSFAVGAYIAYRSITTSYCPEKLARVLLTVAVVLTLVDFAVAAFVPAAARYKEFELDVFGTVAVGLAVFAIPHVAWRPLDVGLRSRFVAIVAANAYALYLLHVPIKQTVDSFLSMHGFIANTSTYGIFFSLGFCACCSIGVPLLHRFVEQPFLTIKERARETGVLVA